MLAKHIEPGAHMLPQPPQLSTSFVMSTQPAGPQSAVPVGQTQVPEMQLAPAVHARLQSLQLAGSVDTSTHAPLQMTCEPGQAQFDAVQLAVAGHAMPHPPQWALLEGGSTQLPAQRIWGAGQPLSGSGVDPPQQPATHSDRANARRTPCDHSKLVKRMSTSDLRS